MDLQPETTARGFALAGGTSLALRLGHRLSIDLDFFTGSAFEPARLAESMGFGPDAVTGMAQGTLQLQIHGIKLEFLRHSYPSLAPPEVIDGIMLWSLEDVTAMKLNAIANRGSKKDFWDIAAILEIVPLDAMLELYRKKYRPGSLLMAIRSLAWFEDAEAEPDPVTLRNQSWSQVKETIASAIRSLS